MDRKLSEIIEKNNSRARILGYPVDLVSMQDALLTTESNIKSSTGAQVVTINPEMIMYSLKNPEFGEILRNADLILPDGVGIKIALKKMNLDIEQVPGIEFSHNLIELSVKNGYKIGFIGASKDVITRMVSNFKSEFPDINIVFEQDGYFSEDDEPAILSKIKKAGPQILFVALGVPKQELWIAKYKQELSSVIMIGVGGSFDVWAGKIKRAPVAFRKLGLEWFYRLISQPSRFSRMFPTLPLFFVKVWLDKENTGELK